MNVLKYGPYSPSRLETATCPYSFYRQYVDPVARVKRHEGVPQARGSVVHEVFERFTEQYKTNPKAFWDDKTIGAEVSKAIGRHAAAVSELPEIVEMVRRYIAKPPRVLHQDAEVEKMLAVKLDEGGQFVECEYDHPEAAIRGRADILSFSDDLKIGYLYDHKTQPNKEEADTFQLGVYAWLIFKIHPYLEEVRTILHLARYGFYSEHCIWVKNRDAAERLCASGEVDPEYVINIEALEDELMTRISIIEAVTEWTATPHKNCIYCPVMESCPYIKEILEVDADSRLFVKPGQSILGDTNQAVRVAGYITILEEIVKKFKDDLKTHVTAFGPIAIPGKRYCFKTEENIDWDKVNKGLKIQACNIFEEFGIDPKHYMGFSQTFSKSIMLMENKELRDKLLALFPRKLSSEFRGVKY